MWRGGQVCREMVCVALTVSPSSCSRCPLGICVPHSLTLCCDRVCSTAVCVSRWNFWWVSSIEALRATGSVWLDAWWYSMAVLRERKPPRKAFFSPMARTIGTWISFGGISGPKVTSTEMTSAVRVKRVRPVSKGESGARRGAHGGLKRKK